jgi:tetratricopeptide (TPR) repeat protein
MTPPADPAAPDGPDETEVRAALERVLASASFRGSPQLGAFLRFVVDETLHGRGANLKGYTIAVEALGRDPRFNPQIDPIVRVEATRLRRALERYHAGEGLADPVIIDLPRGSYAPTFARRGAATAVVADAAASASRWPILAGIRRAPLRGALGVLVIAAIGAVAVRVLPWPNDNGAGTRRATGSIERAGAPRGLPNGNGMPTIEIEALHVVGTPGRGDIAVASLTESIKDAFARFDTVNVASESPPAGASGSALPPAARADYRLLGTIEYADSGTTLRFQLVDTAEGTIAWTRSIEAGRSTGDPGAAEDRIVVTLTEALLQSYGVIRARDHAKQLAAPVGDPRYRCVLETAESFRSFRPADHARAGACLDRLIATDPSFAVGFEFLAALEIREYAYARGAHTTDGDQAILDRALRAARRAIELNPASGRAYQMLFVVLFARGDFAAAFAAGDKAMALNRYDMTTVAEYGGRLIMRGDVDRGMAMLRRAGENGGVRPSWQNFYLFLGSYLGGDMKEAAFHAEQIIADDYPLGLVARAIAANTSGNKDQARRLLARLIDLNPAWRTDPRSELARVNLAPEIVDRLLHDLVAAGLPGAS